MRKYEFIQRKSILLSIAIAWIALSYWSGQLTEIWTLEENWIILLVELATSAWVIVYVGVMSFGESYIGFGKWNAALLASCNLLGIFGYLWCLHFEFYNIGQSQTLSVLRQVFIKLSSGSFLFLMTFLIAFCSGVRPSIFSARIRKLSLRSGGGTRN